MDESDLIPMLVEQAMVHERNGGCVGLPACASCRAAALLRNDMKTLVAQAWIDGQEPGTVVFWKGK